VGFSAFNTKVYNNTVYNNGAADGISIGDYRATGTVVKNNIVYGNTGSNIRDVGMDTTLSNNLTTDPKFVNPSIADFHLQSTSPAIDAGATLTEVTTDFEGTSRPRGAAYDIGAFEFGGGSPPMPGDLTGDGDLTLADLRLLIQMLVGQTSATAEAKALAAPADQLTLADVRALIQLLVAL
jgi:hypothetical protein